MISRITAFVGLVLTLTAVVGLTAMQETRWAEAQVIYAPVTASTIGIDRCHVRQAVHDSSGWKLWHNGWVLYTVDARGVVTDFAFHETKPVAAPGQIVVKGARDHEGEAPFRTEDIALSRHLHIDVHYLRVHLLDSGEHMLGGVYDANLEPLTSPSW